MAEVADINGRVILADGGIANSGSAMKAFLAGASMIMSGRLFVEAEECRMHQPKEERMVGKYELPAHNYFGMASQWGKVSMNGGVLTQENIEGKVDFIHPTEKLQYILESIWEGIRSGVSYSGYKTLTDAIGNGVFELVHK